MYPFIVAPPPPSRGLCCYSPTLPPWSPSPPSPPLPSRPLPFPQALQLVHASKNSGSGKEDELKSKLADAAKGVQSAIKDVKLPTSMPKIDLDITTLVRYNFIVQVGVGGVPLPVGTRWGGRLGVGWAQCCF